MGDITGTTFAGYDVRDAVGTDLVSTLYRATDPDEDRTVALRVISQHLCDVEGPDRQLYRRFRAQATASLKFEHAHSPRVEEVGEHHRQGYVVSGFIDAVPLSQLIDDHPALRVDAALALFEQLADVLDTAQLQGLTHGAVSPSTISFARPSDGARPEAAYLSGYGVGALLELRLKRDRKQLTVVDDLLYVAPEQLRQQTITGRTDQYALACALVHVLTGTPPFVRDSIGGLFGAHLFVEPELDASRPWAAAVRKGMAKEPEQRFERCGDLIAAMKADVRRAVTRALRPQADTVIMRDVAKTPVRDDAARTMAPERATRAVDDPRPAERRVRRVVVEGGGEPDDAGVFATSTPAEHRNGARPRGPGIDEDAPLLSEVLSQHDRRRGGRRLGAGGLLLLALLALAAVVVVLWLVVT
jgi:serine/threonine protein kinase